MIIVHDYRHRDNCDSFAPILMGEYERAKIKSIAAKPAKRLQL